MIGFQCTTDGAQVRAWPSPCCVIEPFAADNGHRGEGQATDKVLGPKLLARRLLVGVNALECIVCVPTLRDRFPAAFPPNVAVSLSHI